MEYHEFHEPFAYARINYVFTFYSSSPTAVSFTPDPFNEEDYGSISLPITTCKSI